ncbi:Imm51 family immunity protein [Glycomyces tritici]|uniref:Imm51 family immunity protein n=1 Tax=Glycomyces tritici TaxID=2665176 RepID=A0ABT7YSV9_9ACTN|nr:Imm51 family immunity protein [Glycomyces tritici]MDN3241459.1 Imm51 family immunity protein [Glycomyces tritici]MDN3242246.1 Imm51 family immunity protein [Glycomyces tritici]
MSEPLEFSRFPNVTFVDGETSDSVIYSPNGPADAHLREVFAAHGLEGSGYDWQSAVHAALLERTSLLERFSFDCEAGMFCAYGTDREALGEVATTLEALLERPVQLVEALAIAAEHDLFD